MILAVYNYIVLYSKMLNNRITAIHSGIHTKIQAFSGLHCANNDAAPLSLKQRFSDGFLYHAMLLIDIPNFIENKAKTSQI